MCAIYPVSLEKTSWFTFSDRNTSYNKIPQSPSLMLHSYCRALSALRVYASGKVITPLTEILNCLSLFHKIPITVDPIIDLSCVTFVVFKVK